MRTYGQPSGQLFQKRWPLSNQTELRYNVQTSGETSEHRLGMVSNELLGGGGGGLKLVLRRQTHPP